jgi:putative hydrolase of the HAD superfamily
MIDTVTIDFWGTLLTDTPENMERAKTMRLEGVGMVLARSGQRITYRALMRAYDVAGQTLARVWQENRDLTIHEQLDAFLSALAPDLPGHLNSEMLRQIEEAYVAPALSFPPDPSPGVIDAVSALRQAGFTLCVISNTGRTPGTILRKLLDRYGLLNLFTVVTFSDEIGYRKPHSEIFRQTLSRVGRDPARALHVGDDIEADIGGAKRLGMRAVLYSPHENSPRNNPSPDAVLKHFSDLPVLLQKLADQP